MHPSVREAWKAFNEPLEGAAIPYMYVDAKRLVTVGTGNLIDPLQAALGLPWQIDGRKATRAEVTRDWTAVKNTARHDLHHRFAASLTACRLTPQALDDLLYRKLEENYEYLALNHFPEIDGYPADAQMAILSLAWACGPNWPRAGKGGFPKTKAAVLKRDWAFAATEGKINAVGNPGVIPRNHANERCFLNAVTVDGRGLDRSKLHWPASAYKPPCECCGRPF